MYVLVHVRSTDCELPPYQYFERLTQLATTHTQVKLALIGVDPLSQWIQQRKTTDTVTQFIILETEDDVLVLKKLIIYAGTIDVQEQIKKATLWIPKIKYNIKFQKISSYIV